ncbi:MAG: hypothetical protein E5Y56_29320, partial [Mesorhizobium sp.]
VGNAAARLYSPFGPERQQFPKVSANGSLPPPCGEGLGVGVRRRAKASAFQMRLPCPLGGRLGRDPGFRQSPTFKNKLSAEAADLPLAGRCPAGQRGARRIAAFILRRRAVRLMSQQAFSVMTA